MTILKKLGDLFRHSPTVRLAARAGATAVAAYIATAIKAHTPIDPTALLVAGGTAVGYTILGLFTPVEPHVGPAKAKVEIPS